MALKGKHVSGLIFMLKLCSLHFVMWLSFTVCLDLQSGSAASGGSGAGGGGGGGVS